MKNKLFRFIAIALVGLGFVILNACQKDDTIAPLINFNDAATTIYISLNHRYVDYPPVAFDDKDGNVKVTSDNSYTNPNTDLVGTYTIHYSAADNTGNIGRATRTIIVTNDSKNLEGIYDVDDNINSTIPGNSGHFTYIVSVVASTTLNNKLFITNLSDLGGSITDTAVVAGGTLTMTSQKPSGMKNPGTVNGTGNISSDNKRITDVNYTINYTSGGTDTGVSNWTKHP